MWQFDPPPAYRLADTGEFLHALEGHADFFDPADPVVVARAPGRLDLMGGIADYSGSLVLELPLSVAAWVAVQPTAEPVLTVRTLARAGLDGPPDVALPTPALLPPCGPLSHAAAHDLFAATPGGRWAAYILGGLPLLHAEYGARVPGGLRVLVFSEVPLGKGVSSSAAVEVAALTALAAQLGVRLAPRELALLAQIVENLVVGAPCGIMDQMTAACGAQDQLLALLCQPAELQDHVPIPPGVVLWGLDSGIRHAVSGADYASVRVGAFMGYRILADLAGCACRPLPDGRVQIDDPRWRGYLANVTPAEWAAEFAARVPETVSGAEFLARYGGSPDVVTRVEPARTYAVRVPTAHPIHEHDRVRRFRSLLEELGGEPRGPLAGAAPAADPGVLTRLGELMYASHASYSACGLGSDGTDRLVALVQAAGPDTGLYGAKITGGGSGGTVAVLATPYAFSAVQRIARAYEAETGRSTRLLGGSSPGAGAFGVQRLVWTVA